MVTLKTLGTWFELYLSKYLLCFVVRYKKDFVVQSLFFISQADTSFKPVHQNYTTMENFFVDKDTYSPLINLNARSGICEIRGDSHMEHPRLFYKSALYWLQNFVKQGQQIQFNFFLKYYNTGSSRVLFEIFSLLEKAAAPAHVNWHAEQRDSDMIDEGESFKEDFPKINFQVITKKKIAF